MRYPALRSLPRPLPLLLLLGTLGGCAASLPTHPWPGPVAALDALAQRQARIRTVSAHADLHLRRPDGQSVTLEAALVAKGPDHLRLRAWKLQQAVFDLTVRPEGLWLWASPPPDDAPAPPPAVPARPIAEAWALLAGGIFQPDRARIEDEGGAAFRVRAPLAAGGSCTAVIDRATLTVREYRFRDPAGQLRQVLRLDRYRLVGDLVFPHRWVAEGEAGRITLNLDDVELNRELPAGALTPPARATRQP